MAKSDERNESSKSDDGSNKVTSSLTTPLLAVAAITTVVGFAILFASFLKASIDPGLEMVQIAAKQYANGNYVTAAKLAEQSILSEGTPQETERLRQFLIGAGMANDALFNPNPRASRTALFRAIPELQAASSKWPGGREDEGDRLLGLAYFATGQFQLATTPLKRCIQRNATLREELVPKLAQCFLHGNKEEADLAIQSLAMIDPDPSLHAEALDDADFLRAQAWTKLGKYEQARSTLDGIASRIVANHLAPTPYLITTAAKVDLLRAAVDVSEAIERFGKSSVDEEPRQEVIDFLAPAQALLSQVRRDASPELANQANLWAARGFLCAGQDKEALNLFSAVRQQQPFEAANIAAGIEEVELLADTGNGEEVLQTVRYLLREIGNEQDYDGSIIDLMTFRSRLITALQTLRGKNRYRHCLAIAKVLPSLFPLADAHYEEAVTFQQDAERTLAAARRSNGDVDSSAMMIAKQKYRSAGQAFREAARLRFDTTMYCDTLWQAIQCDLDSGQFAVAVDLLDDFLRYEDRRRQPRALLALGKARLATGDADKALLSLEECIIEFPRDPLRYDARLYAALSHAESERFEKARELLDENLTDGGLTPQSDIWKDSLYTLGELLFREANQTHLRFELDDPRRDPQAAYPIAKLRDAQPIIEEAIVKLSEAVTRYWPEARAKHAAYLQARAHKIAAVWPKLESESADALDAAKRQLRLQADQHLTSALSGFTLLRRDLATREEEQPLNAPQQAMLRNCYIAEADTLFDLGQYEQSAEAFRAVSLRYLNEPPALEAMLGQSRCLQQMQRPREARLVIRQAIVVLGRIPTDADTQFLQTTRYDRKRWQDLLSWLDSGPMPEDSDA